MTSGQMLNRMKKSIRVPIVPLFHVLPEKYAFVSYINEKAKKKKGREICLNYFCSCVF